MCGLTGLQPQAYWSLAEVAERGTADRFTGSDAEAVNELARLMGKAVAGQQVADVPLGALLSGGIDDLPLDQWLRGPLREWAGDLLNEDRLRREGYLRPEMITQTWQAHLNGNRSFGYWLWSVLMFQAWLEQQEVNS